MTDLLAQLVPSRSDREWLVEWLADRDAPCPNCGYNLRGLTCANCPECGMEVRLRIGLAEPRWVDWIVGLIGLAVSLGWSGGISAMFLIAAIFGRGSHDAIESLLYFAPGALISGLLTWAWVACRTWLRARSTFKRRVLTVACWIVPIANLIGFALLNNL